MSSAPEPDSAGLGCVLRAWHAHEAELQGFLAHQTADSAAAEDLLQDVFVKAMRQGQGFCTLDHPRAWLFQVARHALIDRARAQRPYAELSDAIAAPDTPQREAVDALDACLTRQLPTLDAADRDILQACDLDGQTVRAYAQAHGLGLPAAKSRLLRARQRLRAALVERCQIRFDADGQVCCHTPPATR